MIAPQINTASPQINRIIRFSSQDFRCYIEACACRRDARASGLRLGNRTEST